MQWHKERSAVQLHDVHAFKDAVDGDMTTVEGPNGPARAFEANAEYIAQILEEVLGRLQLEHTEKEDVKTMLVSAYQELKVRSQQLKDENTEKNKKIHELAQLQQVLRQEVDEKQRTLNQVAELREHEKELEAMLEEVSGKVDPEQATACSICFNSGCDSVLSPCGHLFHHVCINRAFQSMRDRSSGNLCPECRCKKGPSIARVAIDPHCKADEDGRPEVWDQYVILIGGGKPETREQLERAQARVDEAQARAAAESAARADAVAAGS